MCPTALGYYNVPPAYHIERSSEFHNSHHGTSRWSLEVHRDKFSLRKRIENSVCACDCVFARLRLCIWALFTNLFPFIIICLMLAQAAYWLNVFIHECIKTTAPGFCPLKIACSSWPGGVCYFPWCRGGRCRGALELMPIFFFCQLLIMSR